jgi:hypothetical protein
MTTAASWGCLCPANLKVRRRRSAPMVQQGPYRRAQDRQELRQLEEWLLEAGH